MMILKKKIIVWGWAMGMTLQSLTLHAVTHCSVHHTAESESKTLLVSGTLKGTSRKIFLWVNTSIIKENI